ncbi:MAG: hypothetical protein J6X75_06010 [Clostridia bacterium]|nr:hypothetical protein [Clostridia bacterium]
MKTRRKQIMFEQLEQIYEVDPERVYFDKRYSIPGMITHYQDAVLRHTAAFELDRKVIFAKYNVYWVIAKLHINIHSYPMVDDKVKLVTYPLKPMFVKFERECGIYKGEELCVEFCTEWCLVDGDTKRIRRADSIAYPPLWFKDRQFTDDYCRFVSPAIGEENYMFSHRVALNDLDLNIHMNNISYVRLAMNTLTDKEYTSYAIKTFDIRFRAQTYFGDNINIFRKNGFGEIFIVGKKDDGTVVFEVRMTY